MLQFSTKYFGQIEADPSALLSFPDGLFGFEEEKQFLLLPFEGSNQNLLCFQSTATPTLAFVAMNPFSLKPDYRPILTQEELSLMGVQSSEELCYYVLCAVREPVGDSTVNLRCPIVVNPETQKAVQVILETGDYHMRHPLSEFRSGRENPVC